MDKQLNYLFIIGVHRSGTSALFEYLKEHPEITPAKKKELHYFTPIRFNKEVKRNVNYSSFFFKPSQETKYLLEASPSYFYGGEKLLNEITERTNKNSKFILMLRNPTDRFISFYNHLIYTNKINRNVSLLEFINDSKLQLHSPIKDTPASRGLREGIYVDYLSDWTKKRSNEVAVYFFDDLVASPNKIVSQISEWLNIQAITSDNEYTKVNDSRKFKSIFIHKSVIKLNQRISKKLTNRPLLKHKLRKLYNTLNTDILIKKEYEEERLKLDEFYKKSNKELREYLANTLEYTELPLWLAEA